MANEAVSTLSPRQEAILQFIRRFRESHAYGPTRNEIVEHLGLSSTSVCQYNLQALRRLGLVTWVDLGARTLDVVRQVASRPICPRCGNAELFNVLVPSLVGYEWELGTGWTREGDGDAPSERAIRGLAYQVSCAGCGESFEGLPWS